ncbi:MAG TPA: DUF3891 family protein [Gaiellaceae bacterium]|nr:DUF3891 family protein [Gaiellaceae bacterium]
MIVRDRGVDWQVVLQTDHADLSGALARAWSGRGPRHGSLEVAAKRHDDGWAVWERSPRLDPESGAPVNFLDVDVTSHLAFYRAGIAAITEEDPYAGLLVSMHGAGIYRQRYGRDPGLGLSRAPEVQALVDAFVDEQEAGYEERLAATGASDEERWRDYELLQLFDRLSLHFCMRDVDADGGKPVELQGYTLEPAGPWRVRISPFPFAEAPARFELVRRLLPKGTRSGVLAVPGERVGITFER